MNLFLWCAFQKLGEQSLNHGDGTVDDVMFAISILQESVSYITNRP